MAWSIGLIMVVVVTGAEQTVVAQPTDSLAVERPHKEPLSHYTETASLATRELESAAAGIQRGVATEASIDTHFAKLERSAKKLFRSRRQPLLDLDAKIMGEMDVLVKDVLVQAKQCSRWKKYAPVSVPCPHLDKNVKTSEIGVTDLRIISSRISDLDEEFLITLTNHLGEQIDLAHTNGNQVLFRIRALQRQAWRHIHILEDVQGTTPATSTLIASLKRRATAAFHGVREQVDQEMQLTEKLAQQLLRHVRDKLKEESAHRSRTIHRFQVELDKVKPMLSKPKTGNDDTRLSSMKPEGLGVLRSQVVSTQRGDINLGSDIVSAPYAFIIGMSALAGSLAGVSCLLLLRARSNARSAQMGAYMITVD